MDAATRAMEAGERTEVSTGVRGRRRVRGLVLTLTLLAVTAAAPPAHGASTVGTGTHPWVVVLCNFSEFRVYDFETQMDSPVDVVRSPLLGEHNAHIYGDELGRGDELPRLKAKGVI